MSYIIKKQRFLKSLDKIKETCTSNDYEIPELLKNYPAESNEDYDKELKKFFKNFPEFSDIAIDLNPEQEEIVTYDGDKFLSVEAGPGAGKTRVLIEKVNYMVNELGVDPETLLIITFSTKAAEELQERLSEGDLLKSDVQKMHISTIHSFCGKILEDAGEVDLDVISDESGGKNFLFIGKHLKELGFVNEAYMSNGEIPYITGKYNEYCSFDVDSEKLINYIEETRPVSEEYIDFVREYMEANDGKFPYDEVKENDEFKKSKYNAKYLQIAKSYEKYEEILKREKAIDFAHMQKNALEIVQKEGFETRFTNILIDEFQDSDPMQIALFESLMENAESFTVVGDINQSIYGFRGSNINPFTYLAKNHGDKFEFKSLPTNYRSTHEIIDISEDFIKHQRPAESALGKAECGRDINNNIYYLVTDYKKTKKGETKPVKIEADNIFKIINYLIKNEKVNRLSDIGILFRSIMESSSRCIGYLLEDLNSAGINYQINTADLIEQPEIKSVLTLFYHLVSDDDPHKHFFNKWETDWLNLKAYADQILFELSDETKDILYKLQDKFEEEVVKTENEVWLRDHSRGGVKSFEKVLNRDEEMLIEIFERVERPVLTNENLIEYGITNEDDLEFFKRLNELKDSLYSEDVKFYERPTVSEVYLKLLTDVSGFLTEDIVLESDEVIYNLSQITHSLQIFSEVRFERDIRGAFWFIYRTIEGHSGYKPESDAIQIMTIHKSKGLEFPVVIIPSFKKDTFPKKYENPNPESGWKHGSPVYYTPDNCLRYPKFDEEIGPELSHQMEEERVIYVAMTRAQDTLILSSLVENVEEAKKDAIENDAFESLPKGPKRLENAINENLSGCKFIDVNNIEIDVLPRTCEEEDEDDYCIDLSFTALENYNSCPFRYKLANEIGFNVTEKQEIDEGIFVHKALEVINKKIINNQNKFIGNEEVIKTITELFEKSNEELHEEDPVEYQKQLDEIIENVIYYYDNYGKDIKILDSEYPFYLKDKHYALKGVVDLIYEVDGNLGIIDYKNTRLEAKYKDKFKKQLHLYVLALRDQNQEYEGKEISELKVYTIKSKKLLEFEIDEAYIDELEVELENVASSIHKKEFKSSKCDDCKYCQYKNICRQS
ncbi:MAG: ATP-dependent helicase [Methanobrevibacter millerae]|uniref:DNA 3'-5' helicase n=1 Tax=Methanobrevibacter millerae TaxID=230361 RepID=A0A8T3VEU4_9EURY|nr:ATP-dependent DNA helicase [Methanobrevibacter millerae]MBE6505712.1 ATP-dependent helicase [Methanobrevibacter millerae]